jgi:hypothetical protein
MRIEKYSRVTGWYVKIDGVLVAGFKSENHADIFIEALENERIKGS